MKKILVDVDGVLADFTGIVLGLVGEMTGKTFTAADVKTWEIFESLQVEPDVRERVYRVMRASGGCSRIVPYEGAAEGLGLLRQVADVVFVTSPFKDAPSWTWEREQWLEKHFGVDRRLVIHARDKSHVCGDGILDDNPEHLGMWGKAWPGRLRMHWTGNGTSLPGDPDSVAVRSWAEVVRAVSGGG